MKNGSTSEYWVEGVLRLSRVIPGEWRRRWGIPGIQTFEERVDVGADDGHREAATSYSSAGTDCNIGSFNVGAGQKAWGSWFRFDPVDVPAGAIVQTAYIVVQANTTNIDGSGTKTNVAFEAADDPTAPTDGPDFDGRTRTSAVAWDDEDFVVDVDTNSPDLSTPLQEVFDRPGWATGQAVQVLWDNDGSSNDKLYQINSYDNDAPTAVLLHVEYST